MSQKREIMGSFPVLAKTWVVVKRLRIAHPLLVAEVKRVLAVLSRKKKAWFSKGSVHGPSYLVTMHSVLHHMLCWMAT